MLGYPFSAAQELGTLEKDCGQYDTPRDVFWASGACLAVRASVSPGPVGLTIRSSAHMEEIGPLLAHAAYGLPCCGQALLGRLPPGRRNPASIESPLRLKFPQ